MTRPHRRLAHSYLDELAIPRPAVVPVVTTWRDCPELVLLVALNFVILLTLLLSSISTGSVLG